MATENYVKVRRVLWIILFANMAVAALKIVIGTMIISAGMSADGFHSLTDGTSNIVGLIGIWFASKPVDDEHPYGHRKFETLAALFIAAMLFFIAGKIIVEAIERFIHPVKPDITMQSLIVLLATLFINIFVCAFELKKGKKLNSLILVSDSMHTRSDIFVSIGVLVSLICVRLGLPPVIDSITSLIISFFIIYAAYEIFRDNSGVLVDKAVVDTGEIRKITLGFEQVKDIHNIRSRGSEGDLYIDMHIMTEPGLSIEESHSLIHRIEERIQEEVSKDVQLIAHLEPFHDERV
jgi:cation diffusion facilitator family transporter